MVDLLTESDWNALIIAPEGQTLDRKSARIEPRDLADTLIAFANADGGRVLIGIENDGTVSGINPAAHDIKRLLHAAYEFCEPSVSIEYQYVSYQGRQILIISVPTSTNVHNHNSGRVYLRVLDHNQLLSVDETLRLAFAKGQASYETQPVQGATLADLDHELMTEYTKLRGLDQPAERILRGLHLMQNDNLTVAGVLLFAQEPSRWLPRAGVDFLKFEGATVNLGTNFNLVERKELYAPLPRLIRRSWDLLEALVRTRYRLQGLEMASQSEYPDFAWREVIVNAIAHRDYSITGTAIQIRMFDNRLEVESPGRLPGIVTVENIRHRHFSRNPQIVGILKAWRYIEELGFGMDRVFQEMESAGAPHPTIIDMDGCVTVTLPAIPPQPSVSISAATLNDRQEKALVILAERGQFTNRDYREMFHVTDVTAYNDLKDLLKKGLIQRIGKGRSVSYRPVRSNQ